MNITVSQVQAKVLVTVLQPHGELDASNYQDLIAEAQRAYDARRSRHSFGSWRRALRE